MLILMKYTRKLVNALPRENTLLNTFFIPRYNYCPLTWMWQCGAKNTKINRLHERCLRVIYNDKASTFEQLLEKDSSVSIYTRNLRFLAVDMFKVVKGPLRTIINDLFPLKKTNNYNLRQKLFFKDT